MEDREELQDCYYKIAEYNNLVDLGGNRWKHTPTGFIYVLTSFGFQRKENSILEGK